MYVIQLLSMQKNIKILTDVILLCILFEEINGIKDANTLQTSINSCILPPHPRFGGWTVFQTNLAPSVGDAVPVGTILEISCYYGYKLNGGAISACIRGQWRPEVGQCLRTCPSLRTTTITTVSCTYKGETLATCLDVVEETRAHFQCSPFYEIQGLNKFPIRICSKGQWSGGIPECVPVCGKKGITKDPTLIVGGFNTTSLEYPWQTALYFKRTKVLICGGTLLSQKTILTAAHCVTNDKGQLQPKENYIVAVGKSYRSYNDSRDNAAQFSSIEEMNVSRQYKGYIQRYFGDIAIIVANTTFVLSLNVQPVCVVWEKKFHQSLENVTRVNQTYASGWGFTSENKNPSDVLKSLKVPLISKDECERSLSEDDLEYLTDDKLCAGFLESGKSVCKGDSGGGLVTKHGGRYYIIAVVSIAPQSSTAIGGCDSQQYGLYTRFSYYIDDFLIDVEARFAPSEQRVDCTDDDCFTASTNVSITSARSGCILPDHPMFGNWSIFGAPSNHFMPGTLVVPGTVLKIECKQNYTLSGHGSLFCENEFWSSNVGECLGIATPKTQDLVTTEQEVHGLFGDHVTLECAAAGNPTPKITWTKDNTLIDGTRGAKYRIKLDQSLQIIMLEKSDAGVYLCTTEKATREATTKRINLVVTDGPQRPATILESESQGKVVVSLNSSLTLNCLAVGYPLPVVTWWFNGTLISIQSSQFETGKDNSLRIESVRSSNLGVYTCQTYNGVGKSASWSVTVEARETNQDTSPKGTDVQPDCQDNPFFANCRLIVKANFCTHKYYARFCCKACTEAGLIPVVNLKEKTTIVTD
ncbi:uncharacterized protein LOC135126225 isoform X2 [Zophobas morio]|uniref:uncharacterized protein LOC135126225 isoform X2 n=1 Tax=Zophobas morio TaxID=2755281 RepID=UPI003083DE36